MTTAHRPRIRVAMPRRLIDIMLTPDQQARLATLGEVSYAPDGGEDDIARAVRDHEILVTSWGTPRLPAAVDRAAGDRLAFVGHTAGSVRALAPRELVGDVAVSQAAYGMADAVAELALTLCLVLLRHVHHYDRTLQTSGDWQQAQAPGLGRALAEQRIGVVGASRVGVSFIEMVRGLGARDVRLADPYVDAGRAAALGVRLVPLDELFAGCDVVALHAPATPETHHLVGARQLAALPDGAVLVNTARSAVVDTEALVAELRTGRISAGLDVFDTEPLPVDSPLRGLPNVVVTPHQAGATAEARALQGRVVVDEIARFVAGEPLQHQVTVGIYDRLA